MRVHSSSYSWLMSLILLAIHIVNVVIPSQPELINSKQVIILVQVFGHRKYTSQTALIPCIFF